MSDPASTVRRSRTAVRQTWAERLERFAAAALAPAEFCAAEGVSVASFYAWKRRLAAEQRPPAAGAEAVLLPVRLAAGPAPVELVLPGGAVLRLSPGCDLNFVRSVLAALGATPCLPFRPPSSCGIAPKRPTCAWDSTACSPASAPGCWPTR